MTNENILCTMTGYYHDCIKFMDDKLNKLSDEALGVMLRYRVNKPEGYTVNDPGINTTSPIRVNLIIRDTNNSHDTIGLTYDGDIPGGYISEWIDMYDYNSDLYPNENSVFVYRAIIRNILNQFASVSNENFIHSSYKLDRQNDCWYVLANVLRSHVGAYLDVPIEFDQDIYYWFGSCMEICVVCSYNSMIGYTTPFQRYKLTRDISREVKNEDLIRAIFNTSEVFQSSL